MADETPKSNPAPADDESAKAEAHFWEEHKNRTLAVLDEWLEKKQKEAPTGSSRGTGRTTLPGILADILFPEKK
jgi:hypothetical protein